MTGRELQVDDFSFDGPLGCDGASIEKVGVNHFRVIPGHAPCNPGWANMINFTIRQGARGNRLRLEAVFHNGNNMRFNDYSYSWSYDAENWRPVHWEKFEKDGSKGDSLLFPVFEHDSVYVGHQVPMSYEMMAALLEGYERHQDAELTEIGRSIGGRPLLRLSVTDAGSDRRVSERFAHYFTNQHPGEHNAQWRMIGMIEWLLEGSGEAREFLHSQVAHFVVMMSPDAPSKGWYRVNAEGVDMNRSYLVGGSDAARQAHEAFAVQSDLEQIADVQQLRSVWAHHTWQGVVEPLVLPGRKTEEEYGSWEQLRDQLLAVDINGRLKPLKKMAPAGYSGSWGRDPHEQFGVSAFLCEGAGSVYHKGDCLDAGRAIMEGIARYCAGSRDGGGV